MTAIPTFLKGVPPPRGRLTANAPLARLTWLRVGGPADAVFRPADADDLAAFRRALPRDVPVLPLGVGSNLLARDGGYRGVVVRLAGALAAVRVEGDAVVAGAGLLDRHAASVAARAGIAGLEFLVGIPGTLGGAVRMNAGAFGGETAEVVENVTAIDPEGRRHVLTGADLGFAYRRSRLPEDWIVTEVRLRGRPGDPGAVAARMEAIRAEREASQPLRVATGGSTFKNPPGGKAWRLIDAAGCRGLRRGGAVVSDKHCNFLVNRGDATAHDLEALGETVRSRVLASGGVGLEWEVIRLGVPLRPSEAAA